MSKDPSVDSRSPTPVRVLHLSDFHFNPQRRWDSDPVLTGLTRAIGQLVSDGLAPDVVAVTGDVADQGRAEDYQQARQWIDTGLLKTLPTDFPRDRILVVPGNHDVDRAAVKTAAQGVQNTLLHEQSQEAIAAVLADPDERAVPLKRHAQYLEFINSLHDGAAPLDVPWWSRRLEVRGVAIHFVGLCTSWMSWSDNDPSRLLVGVWQAQPLLGQVDDAAMRVVLMHHPWGSFAEFDSRVVEPLVHQRADLLLRGHLHRERTRLNQDPDKGHLELAAGAAYDGSQYANAFQLVELFPAEQRVRVHYRVWQGGRWIPDRNAYQAAADGTVSISLARQAAAVANQPPPPPDATKYLATLRERTSSIDIRGLQVGSGRPTTFPIDELYIPLSTNWVGPDAEGRAGGSCPPVARGRRTRAGGPEGTSPTGRRRRSKTKPPADRAAEMTEYARRTELHEALQAPRLAIVGEPGTGKTTFLRRVASVLCRTLLGDEPQAARELGLDPAPFPILIRLADLASHMARADERKAGPLGRTSPAWLPHYLATHCGEHSLGLDEGFFRGRLESGQAIVLLDGLDEAPTLADRKSLVALIEQTVTAYRDCRFVLTSRPGAFRGEAVLPGWAEVQIEPLEDESIDRFLDRWCQALFRDQPARRAEHLRELKRALASRREIRRMARNPVMLTALAVVHWNEKRLPEQRADLYESIITWLARTRDQRQGRPTPERCIGLLQNLALAMHDHPTGRQTQIKRFAAAQVVAPDLRDVPPDERQAAAERFLADEEVDSGLVVGRGEDDVAFWHLTFQEYLAARALAACSDQDQRRRLFSQPKLYLPEWREVVLLLAGVLYHKGFEPVDRMFGAVLDSLGERPSLADQARCAGLLGAAVRDLTPVRYQVGDARYQRTLDAVMGLFDAGRSADVPIDQAIQAADAPRPGRRPAVRPRPARAELGSHPSRRVLDGGAEKKTVQAQLRFRGPR